MRVLLTTFGSFGDVHPYMAIALELQRRGHTPIIATSELYRAKIEGAGLGFAAVRPDLPPPDEAGPLIAQVMNGPKGSEFLFKKILMPGLRDAYADLAQAAQGADVLVSHVITFAAPLIAQQRGLPWVSTVLAPISFFSAYDPSVPPAGAWLFHLLRRRGPRAMRPLRRIVEAVSARWVAPVYDLRAELGLPRGAHPILDGQHSPQRVLALFSEQLGAPQSDWPANTVQTGFCFYDKRGQIPGRAAEEQAFAGQELAPEIEAFLQGGPPPIVFTLGSAAVFDAGNYFSESAAAAMQLGRRAILLIGDGANRPKQLPPGVAAFDYAPYSALFARCAAVVHQGGVGTTAQAMRAGKPMLIMPFSHDQPDHAFRMQQRGIGRSLPRSRYNAARAAAELKILLEDENYARRAAAIGDKVRAENGPAAACDEIERAAKN